MEANQWIFDLLALRIPRVVLHPAIPFRVYDIRKGHLLFVLDTLFC